METVAKNLANTTFKSCDDGDHHRVVIDRFAQHFKGSRKVPGDCFCLDCKSPLPFWFNAGKPVRAE